MPARPSTPTVRQMRGAIHRRVRRVRAELWGILQTTVAAGSAWALASLLHPHPYFAPASAVIALGVSRGGRTVRAIELTAGVAVGILVADVIVRALGANTLVLMLVVGLSMAAALLLGRARSSSTRRRSPAFSSWPRCSPARAPRRRASSTR